MEMVFRCVSVDLIESCVGGVIVLGGFGVRVCVWFS